MGVDTNLHVGAYLEIYVNPIQVKKEKKCCANHLDKKFKNSEQFCPICGSKLSIQTTIKDKWPYFEDLYEEDEIDIEDAFIQADPMSDLGERILLHSNKHQDKKYPYEKSSFEYLDAEITENMVELYKTNFYNQHKKEIEYLKPKVKSLEVKFGVLYYYS